MKNLALIKKICSILIVICFVLPLSKCTSQGKDGVQKETYHYGFEYMAEQAKEFSEGRALEGAAGVFIYAIVFFIPALALMLRPTAQSAITLVSGIPAFCMLYPHFFVFKPLFGAWLLLSCWVVIVISSLLSLWQKMPHNKSLKDAP